MGMAYEQSSWNKLGANQGCGLQCNVHPSDRQSLVSACRSRHPAYFGRRVQNSDYIAFGKPLHCLVFPASFGHFMHCI